MSVELVQEAEALSLKHTRVRVAAVFEFLKEEILKAAADGHTRMELSVSDQWYHDQVNVKLVESVLRSEGVRAKFRAGTWYLDWSQEEQ